MLDWLINKSTACESGTLDFATDKEIKEYLESEYANMYCCSPECLEKDYLDSNL